MLLVVAIIGSVGTIAYTFQPLKPEDRFTEFYILGPENKAANYPREVFLGENSQVIVGIVNREQMTITYRVEINIGGLRVNQIGPLTLKHDEKWEQIVNFTATKLGLGQKAEFRLYRDEESAPYRTLYLWLDVKE